MATGPRYHHGDLRAALVERGTEMLAEGGVDALSLRELARDLGVSHGAPSRHFPDKQALLDGLAINGFEALRDELAAALLAAGPDATFIDKLTALAAVHVRFAVRNTALLTVMFAAKHSLQAPAELRAAAERAFAAPLAAIGRGQEHGEVVAGPIEEIGTTILATIHGFAALLAGGLIEPDDSGDLLAATMARLVDGLRPRPS